MVLMKYLIFYQSEILITIMKFPWKSRIQLSDQIHFHASKSSTFSLITKLVQLWASRMQILYKKIEDEQHISIRFLIFYFM